MTDAELIRRSRRDAAAFDELFVRHATDIRAYFARRVESEAVALELTAEAFAQAWSGRRRFRAPSDGSAGPWLQGIATNLYRQWARHRRLEAEACTRLGVDVGALTDDGVAERIDAERLGPEAMRRLHELPDAQRDAVRMRVLDDLTYEEIAHRMASTPALARVRVSRGLRSLGHDLAPEVTP
jgi:RNA polymerase sigma-70 factor (ECF subfamily)